jgi:hypothetical protein
VGPAAKTGSPPSGATAAAGSGAPPSPDVPHVDEAPPAPVPVDALELVLLPRRSTEDLLTVEVTVKGRLAGPEGSARGVLLQRSQTVTRGGFFDVRPEGPADEVPPYQFHVVAEF